jgi:hypothetical protein
VPAPPDGEVGVGVAAPVPAGAAAVPALAGAAAPLVPLGAVADAAEVELLLVLLERVDVVDAAALVTGTALGTVKAGAPAVLVALEPAVPQAATPMAIRAAVARTRGRGRMNGKRIANTTSRR